jgi:hypothetical protein
MVEKVVTSPRNVIELARYQQGRNATGKALEISVRACRYCGAALFEGESEDECSSTFNIEAPRLYGGPRKFHAD